MKTKIVRVGLLAASLLSLEEVRTTLDGGFNVKKSLKVRKEKIALWKAQKEAARAETSA